MLGLYLPLQRSESAVFTSEHPKTLPAVLPKTSRKEPRA